MSGLRKRAAFFIPLDIPKNIGTRFLNGIYLYIFANNNLIQKPYEILGVPSKNSKKWLEI
jgi:hypothetical protein